MRHSHGIHTAFTLAYFACFASPPDAIGHARGGILVLPCGFGKTVAALKHICDVGRRALVLVAKSFLMDQWAAQAARWR